MKVVDMFGCGLPVVARTFPALPELVNASRGRVFSTASEFAAELLAVLKLPASERLSLVEGALAFRAVGWDEQWDRVALPLLTGAEGAK